MRLFGFDEILIDGAHYMVLQQHRLVAMNKKSFNIPLV